MDEQILRMREREVLVLYGLSGPSLLVVPPSHFLLRTGVRFWGAGRSRCGVFRGWVKRGQIS